MDKPVVSLDDQTNAELRGQLRQAQTALSEKETLLRKLYYRTQNNMQLICAMLDLQSDRMNNSEITESFLEITQKIQAMSLAHQMLYQARDLTHSRLDEYLAELATVIVASSSASAVRLRLELEPVEALIDLAIPCGLLLNELLSNALKYAFEDPAVGEVQIGLRKLEKDRLELSVIDRGRGFAPGFEPRKAQSLGMQTIFALGESQLSGQVVFEAGPGVVCRVNFPITGYALEGARE